MPIRLNVEDWLEQFKPKETEDSSVKHYETYGEDMQKVLNTDRNLVWTIVDGDDGKLYISPGVSIVNRLNYIICTIPREAGKDYLPIKY